jgi:hypothetical protein
MRSEDDGRGDDGRARLKPDALPTIGTIGLATLLRVGASDGREKGKPGLSGGRARRTTPDEKPIDFSNCGKWRLCARLVVKDLEASRRSLFPQHVVLG